MTKNLSNFFNLTPVNQNKLNSTISFYKMIAMKGMMFKPQYF